VGRRGGVLSSDELPWQRCESSHPSHLSLKSRVREEDLGILIYSMFFSWFSMSFANVRVWTLCTTQISVD
jgi:hypothetical protein